MGQIWAFITYTNSPPLKPFLDSYHAPHKVKHHYWPGLLLVLHTVLLLVFALNPQQDPNINLLAIVVGAGIFNCVPGSMVGCTPVLARTGV